MYKNRNIPDWVSRAPKTPLEEKLHGKIFNHEVICSGNRRKPIGHPGCCCLRRMKDIKS